MSLFVNRRCKKLLQDVRIASAKQMLIDRTIGIEFLQDLIEQKESIACWCIMGSIDARYTSLREPRGHQMVSEDHRLFDEFGSFCPLSIADASRHALITKDRTCFNTIELHAPCCISSLVKPLRKRLSSLYLLSQLKNRFIFELDRTKGSCFLLEGIDQIVRSRIDERLCLVIGKTRIGSDHTREDLIRKNLPITLSQRDID